MTEEDYARKLGEVDGVLNDPDIPIQPALIWRLLAEISEHDSQICSMPSPATRLSSRTDLITTDAATGRKGWRYGQGLVDRQ